MLALNKDDVVGVIGAGTMGIGIAQVAAESGHHVVLYDLSEEILEKNLTDVRSRVQSQVERGKRTQESADELLARFKPTTELKNLAQVKLVIEAIVENLAVKQSLFSDLEEICESSTILTSNTSSISITSIASALKNPQRFLGMHFFNPAPVLPLVEIVSGLATDKNIAATVYATALAWGKSPVYTQSTPGFIVNRVARPFYAEGLRVLEEGGADVATIDGIVRESGGFRMGPFQLMDLIGHDVNYAVTESVFNAYYQDSRFKPSLHQKELVNAGFLGRKTGRGFYNYAATEEEAPATVPAAPKPNKVTVIGQCKYLNEVSKLAQAAKITVDGCNPESDAEPHLLIDDVRLQLTNGMSATEQAAKAGVNNLVLFDLCLDIEKAKRIAITVSQQADAHAITLAAGFFQALGKEVSVISDVPGMVVMRTVCMLANEAADAVNQGVASVADIDIAMCKGVNYPQGPLKWADQMGIRRVFTALQNLQSSYGEERYRPSVLLRKNFYSALPFYSKQQ